MTTRTKPGGSPEASVSENLCVHPFLSVVIPCRNEGAFIGGCLDSILSGDYPKDRLEIIVADGMSEDGTRNIVMDYGRRHPNVKLVDNPNRITPSGMNLGVQQSTGQVIAVVGAHAVYDHNYFSECVRNLLVFRADEVGGTARFVPRKDTPMGRAIVVCLSHPFGAGANIPYKRDIKGPKWVHTVFSGCFRRDVFERIGLFNEDLKHSQDSEFNRRLAAAGGRILLVPHVKASYLCRSDLIAFWKHALRNGVWATLPTAYSEVMAVSWVHLVPLMFVSGLLGSALLTVWGRHYLWLFVLVASLYSFVNLAASIQIARKERDARFYLTMPLVFAILHIGYGLGSLWGLVKAFSKPRFWKRLFRDPVESPQIRTGITPSGSSACEQPANRE